MICTLQIVETKTLSEKETQNYHCMALCVHQPGGHKEMSFILAYSVLVYEPKCGGGGVAGSQPMSTDLCTKEPNLTLAL
jgi:hypothetical protein